MKHVINFNSYSYIPAISTTPSSPFTVSGHVFGAVVGAMGAMLIITTTIAIIATTIAYVLLYKRKVSNRSTDVAENTLSMSDINTERNVAYESVLPASRHTLRNT